MDDQYSHIARDRGIWRDVVDHPSNGGGSSSSSSSSTKESSNSSSSSSSSDSKTTMTRTPSIR